MKYEIYSFFFPYNDMTTFIVDCVPPLVLPDSVQDQELGDPGIFVRSTCQLHLVYPALVWEHHLYVLSLRAVQSLPATAARPYKISMMDWRLQELRGQRVNDNII